MALPDALTSVETDVDARKRVDATASPVVLVCDSRPPSSVLTIVRQSGAAVTTIDGIAALDKLRVTAFCNIAVVGLPTLQQDRHASLNAIAQLKARGFAVLAYARATAEWSMAERCRPLLAGSLALLDSAVSTFNHQLDDWLARLAFATRTKAAERSQIAQAMRTVGVVGESQAMTDVFRLLLRASAFSDLSTIITGETGTGKELIARAAHALDPQRCAGPFVAVDCSAINAGVAETELFGHLRGSFTGADRDRKGLIRAAQGGVLFLDEVGELPLAIQSKLLRVLQDHRVRSVGEDRDAPFGLRIVAATNADLRGMVERGTFRADLFHRLNVLWIHVAPLRERPDDVAPLVRHFAAKHHAVNDRGPRAIAPEFIEALTSLELPGNVRQLEHIVRWALVNNQASPLGLADLPQDVLEKLADREVAPTQSIESDESIVPRERDWNLARSLSSFERATVCDALRASKGNQSKAARMLGVTPRSVHNMIRRHRIS